MNMHHSGCCAGTTCTSPGYAHSTATVHLCPLAQTGLAIRRTRGAGRGDSAGLVGTRVALVAGAGALVPAAGQARVGASAGVRALRLAAHCAQAAHPRLQAPLHTAQTACTDLSTDACLWRVQVKETPLSAWSDTVCACRACALLLYA